MRGQKTYHKSHLSAAWALRTGRILKSTKSKQGMSQGEEKRKKETNSTNWWLSSMRTTRCYNPSTPINTKTRGQLKRTLGFLRRTLKRCEPRLEALYLNTSRSLWTLGGSGGKRLSGSRTNRCKHPGWISPLTPKWSCRRSSKKTMSNPSMRAQTMSLSQDEWSWEPKERRAKLAKGRNRCLSIQRMTMLRRKIRAHISSGWRGLGWYCRKRSPLNILIKH